MADRHTELFPDDAQMAGYAREAEERWGDNVFYDCTDEISAGLAEMYVADPRFAACYDRARPGLAACLRRAMLHPPGRAA